MSELKVLNICGVDCYEKDGMAYLKLETVARGLGFTRDKNGTEYVMWDRVGKYLDELGFHTSVENGVPTCGHDDFIPENIFYRLAMKAKNETAEKFQAKVADEIIPSIRKHGIYATDNVIDEILNNPDFGIELLQKLKEERKARTEAEQKNGILQKENDLLTQKTLEWADRPIINALVRAYGHGIDDDYQGAWREFKKELLYRYGINLNARQTVHLNKGGNKNKKKLDFLNDDEIPQAISTAVAMCRDANIDISDIIQKKAS